MCFLNCGNRKREAHGGQQSQREGERIQRSRCFLIEREGGGGGNIWREKGIKREAWSEDRGKGEHLGYLKAFIQPWDGCREVLTLDRTELEGSCRQWIQQLLHRQNLSHLKHASSSCGLIVLRNCHRERKLSFPLFMRLSIFLCQIWSYNI